MPYFILFYRLIVRPLRREFLRTLLTALAVSLGVAVVIAIELAGDAAAGSFQASVESLTGAADFEVTATGGVPPEALARLAALPYPLKLRPRIEDYVSVQPVGRTVPLIAVDMLADATSANTEAEKFQSDDSIWTGDGLGYKTGDRLRLLINDHSSEFTVRGVLGERSGDVMIMDLAPATRFLGRSGTLDRILIEVPADKPLDAWEPLLRDALPPGVSLARYGSRTNENRRMLAAFPLESARAELHRTGGRCVSDLQHDFSFRGAAARRDRNSARIGRHPYCGAGCISRGSDLFRIARLTRRSGHGARHGRERGKADRGHSGVALRQQPPRRHLARAGRSSCWAYSSAPVFRCSLRYRQHGKHLRWSRWKRWRVDAANMRCECTRAAICWELRCWRLSRGLHRSSRRYPGNLCSDMPRRSC